jgi:hypothetical protein
MPILPIVHGREPKNIFDAAHTGSVWDVAVFIENGWSANEQDGNGWTPLHYAATRGFNFGMLSWNSDVLYFLIEVGANVNGRNSIGETPLDCCNSKGCGCIVRGCICPILVVGFWLYLLASGSHLQFVPGYRPSAGTDPETIWILGLLGVIPAIIAWIASSYATRQRSLILRNEGGKRGKDLL